jgi:hypothetical protein
MPIGLLDLSLVTDRLIQRLNASASASPIKPQDAMPPYSINYSGVAPDAARKLTDDPCQVSVYLFHVAADKFHRNTFPQGGGAQKIPEQPFALTLYYLLSAYSLDASASSFIQEQQAMSIALKCFHENPIVLIDNGGEEITLTLEPQSVDEIGRLWQSLSSPLRLSAVYRASVVFIEPSPLIAPKVVRFPPELEPTTFDVIPGPIVASASADEKGLVAIPIAAGSFGAGTTVGIGAQPLVEAPTATDPLAAGQFRVDGSTDTLRLRVPLYTPQGRFLLTVRPAADKPTIEIWLDVPIVASITADAAGLATIAITGARFDTSVPEVDFGGATLVNTTDPPGPGEFSVVDNETLRLRVPSSTLPGQYLVHVRPAPAKSRLEIWVDVP